MKEFFIDKKMGLLRGNNILYMQSPHQNDRPNENDISLLVLHNISLPKGRFATPHVDNFFRGKLNSDEHFSFREISDMQVSTHLFIQRDGFVTQYVPFHKRAWHAGVSNFNDRENCNDYSIGIELEGTDDIPYTHEQYEQLARVTKLLQKTYPNITLDNIVGHQHVAGERKTDPGPSFNWEHYRSLLKN